MPTKRMSRFFYIDDLRSGHFCNLPIKSQWAENTFAAHFFHFFMVFPYFFFYFFKQNFKLTKSIFFKQNLKFTAATGAVPRHNNLGGYLCKVGLCVNVWKITVHRFCKQQH